MSSNTRSWPNFKVLCQNWTISYHYKNILDESLSLTLLSNHSLKHNKVLDSNPLFCIPLSLTLKQVINSCIIFKFLSHFPISLSLSLSGVSLSLSHRFWPTSQSLYQFLVIYICFFGWVNQLSVCCLALEFLEE